LLKITSSAGKKRTALSEKLIHKKPADLMEFFNLKESSKTSKATTFSPEKMSRKS
jgi:hypothetical protein